MTPTETVSTTACEDRHKTVHRWLGVVMGFNALLISVVLYAADSANTAREESADATRDASKAQAELAVHSARQNGSFESIQSQLSTLRTYHSTLRSEMKEQRKLLDELLKTSHAIPRQEF